MGFFSRLFSGGGEKPAGLPKMEFVDIKPGTFIMGSEKRFMNHMMIRGMIWGRKGGDTSDLDITGDLPHQVTLSKPYSLGKYTVTQKQWEAVMGENPVQGDFRGADKPFVLADLDQLCAVADEFLARLNAAQSEYTYRLPTEAEWEYACRAGTTTPWFFDDEKKVMIGAKTKFEAADGSPEILLLKAWQNEFAKYAVATVTGKKYQAPERVGSKSPNPWGLYDMYGNVWELVQDCFAPYPEGPVTDPCYTKGPDKVFRGGGYGSGSMFARSAIRSTSSERRKHSTMAGFRLARSPRVEQHLETPSPAGQIRQDAQKTKAAPKEAKIEMAPKNETALKMKEAPKIKPAK